MATALSQRDLERVVNDYLTDPEEKRPDMDSWQEWDWTADVAYALLKSTRGTDLSISDFKTALLRALGSKYYSHAKKLRYGEPSSDDRRLLQDVEASPPPDMRAVVWGRELRPTWALVVRPTPLPKAKAAREPTAREESEAPQ